MTHENCPDYLQPSRQTAAPGDYEKFRRGCQYYFQGPPGFNEQTVCYDETTGDGHSVYLWESQEQAEEFFSPAFVEHFREVFGVDPTITYLDIPVLVDNRVGDVDVNEK